jgi:Zn finger protein HypA/HybF involved in hydrogenase expression
MANNVTGKNIMLYNTSYNAKYYFNGGISKGTIGGNAYYQLGTSNNVGAAVNFTSTGDNVIARFITDVNVPGVTNVIAGTWTFSATSKFRHESTGFGLEGQHKIIQCKACHTDLAFKKTSSACITCHQDMHNQTVGNECARCHNSQSWVVENIAKMHATRFINPLTAS